MRKEGDCSENKKIVFMGTPWIATQALKALIDKNYDVVAVVTQPDKVINKKGTYNFSPVKSLALERGIKIFQPLKISEIKDELISLQPDMFITCAYGQFIPDSILSIPKYGCFNTHASVLPLLRGGAPIHWAIINGFKETGITLMKTVKKMDAGDIYAIYKTEIEDFDTTTTLTKKLGNVVYRILVEQIPRIFNNEIVPNVQNEQEATFGYNITKEQEKISFNQSANDVRNWIRGLSDIPGGYALFSKKRVKLFNAYVTDLQSTLEPGTISYLTQDGIYVATTDFDILITEIQIEGKPKTTFANYFNGNRFFYVGKRFE